MKQISKLGWITIKNEEFDLESSVINTLRYYKKMHDKQSKDIIPITGISFVDCSFSELAMDFTKTFKSTFTGEVRFPKLKSIHFYYSKFTNSLFTLDSKLYNNFINCTIENTDFTTKANFDKDKGLLSFNSCTLEAADISNCWFNNIDFTSCQFFSDECMDKDNAINRVAGNMCKNMKFDSCDISNLYFILGRVEENVSLINSYIHTREKDVAPIIGHGIVSFGVKPEQLKVFKSDIDVSMWGGEVYKASNIGPLGLTYYYYAGLNRVDCDYTDYLYNLHKDEVLSDMMRLEEFADMIRRKYSKEDIINLETREEKKKMLKYRMQYNAMIDYFNSLKTISDNEYLIK